MTIDNENLVVKPEEMAEPKINDVVELHPELNEVIDRPIEALPEDNPKVSKIEQEALDKGWVPKTQFKGDPDSWRPAKEWLDRGELIGNLQELQAQVKEQRKVIQDLALHSKKVQEASYKKALEDFKAELDVAVLEGDTVKAARVNEKLVDFKLNQPQPTVAPQDPFDPAKKFVEKNKEWFNTDTVENAAMKAAALKIEQDILTNTPNITVEDLLNTVELKVKEHFPNRFKISNPNQSSPPIVDRSDEVPVKTKEIGYRDLSKHHQVMFTAIKKDLPKFELKDFINELRLTGEL